MARYFFNVREGASYTPDDQGQEMPSVRAARQEAIASAREFLIECLKDDRPLDNQVFEVTDETGRIVAAVPFREAMKTIGA